MLKFDDAFFEEESRLDFTITSTMKHAWAAQLEVLMKIASVCDKHGITYYAFWGTLLGAIRHDGFIPWDDDIDIAMKREDYMRFLEVAADELPKEYSILNIYNVPQYRNTFTRITNSDSIDMSVHHMEEYHGCPFAIGIDIFPLDYIPKDKETADMQREIFDMISQLISVDRYISGNSSENETVIAAKEALKQGIEDLNAMFGVDTLAERTYFNQLRILFDMACMIGNENNGELLTSMPEYVAGNGFVLDKDWFERVEKNFENISLPIPSDYDEVLKALYGDYMTPVMGGAEHDYPFYKDQLAILHEQGLWLDING